METIAERLKFIREEKYGKRGMSKFAKEIKVSPSGYLNYERGLRQIPANVLTRIAKCASVNTHWLLTGDGAPYIADISEIREAGEKEGTLPLFKSVPALVDSLPLTKSDRNQILNMLESEGELLDGFQSFLHPYIVKDFDRSIEIETRGGIQDIPQLVKHCLIRATIGAMAAMLTPEIFDHLRETVHRLIEKNFQLALEYVRLIPDIRLNDKLPAYSGLADRLLEMGKNAEALQVVEEALEVARKQDDPFERMRQLPSIARSYARCGEPGKAHKIILKVNKMLKPELASSELMARFYRQLAEAESEIGYLDRAKKHLNQSLELGQEKLTEPESINIHLSRCSVQHAYLSLKFIGLRNKLEADKSINQAKELLEQIDDPWHQVEALLQGMRIYYVFLNNSAQASRMLLQAMDIAKSIPDLAKQSMALSRIIEACVYDDELDLAENIADEISDPMEASSALLSIAFKHINCNNQEKAKPFLKRAIRLAAKAKDIQGRKEILHRIAIRLLQNHEIHAALKLVQGSVSEDNKMVSLLNLIQSILEGSQIDSVDLSQSSDSKTVSDLMPKSKVVKRALLLTQNAINLAERGDVDEAKKSLAEAIQMSDQLKMPSNQAKIYASIAQSLAKIEDQAQALRFLQKALQNASHSTRDVALDVIANLIPVIISLGGIKLLSEVYEELQRADEIFEV